jgi:hypothetical protein
MAYGVNAPFGLRPYSHLNGGADDIRTNSNYVIDTVTASTLNKGDPVIFAPLAADSAVTAYYKGGQSVITRYTPTVTLQAANNATVITTAPPIVGVFMGCEYWVNGTYYNQEYWVAGTPATSVVRAFVIDDPNVIYDVQLGTYQGSNGNAVGAGAGTAFVVAPTMQRQVANWPNTYNGANLNPTVANSALIGSNVMLLTGRGPTAGNGSSGSLTTITVWDGGAPVVAGYADNPLIANYGNNAGPSNPLGISTYYACPSLAATAADPSIADGRNEYARNANTSFKVLGFTADPRNVPAKFGFPSDAANAGTYFNTPFLNVYGVINNHAFRPGIASVTPA